MTVRNKVHLSASTYLDPQTGSIELSLENNWEDAMKAPAPSRHPTQASSLPLGGHGKDCAGIRTKAGCWEAGRVPGQSLPQMFAIRAHTPSPGPHTQPLRTQTVSHPKHWGGLFAFRFYFFMGLFCFLFSSSNSANVCYTAVGPSFLRLESLTHGVSTLPPALKVTQQVMEPSERQGGNGDPWVDPPCAAKGLSQGPPAKQCPSP